MQPIDIPKNTNLFISVDLHSGQVPSVPSVINLLNGGLGFIPNSLITFYTFIVVLNLPPLSQKDI